MQAKRIKLSQDKKSLIKAICNKIPYKVSLSGEIYLWEAINQICILSNQID